MPVLFISKNVIRKHTKIQSRTQRLARALGKHKIHISTHNAGLFFYTDLFLYKQV